MEDKTILGIDPGLEITGWAIVSRKKGKLLIEKAGHIKTSKTSPLGDRLMKIFSEISLILDENLIKEAAIEEIFFSKKSSSQTNTAYARGVILLALNSKKVVLAEYNPRTVKSTMTGNGNAQKDQMIKTVQLAFGLKNPLLPDDVSDAAAVAFAHFRIATFKNLLSEAQK